MDDIVTIELFGNIYKFKAEDDVENAKQVVEFLKKEVDKVESQLSPESSTIGQFRTLLLASLNITSEYHKLKKSHEESMDNLSTQLTFLTDKLNTGIS